MKSTKNYLLICLCFIIFKCSGQSIGTCGFYSSGNLVNSQTQPVRNGTSIVSGNDFVFYVGANNNKIHQAHFDNTSNKWVWGGTPIFNKDSGRVFASSQIIAMANNDVFYVGFDKLIHKLTYVGNNTWNHSVPVPNQKKVNPAYSQIKNFGNHIYYITTDNGNPQIADIVNVNGVWSGSLLFSGSMAIPRTSTDLVATNDHVYFVATDDLIYDLFFNGSWVPSCCPLGTSNAQPVRKSSQITNEGDHLYYVGKQNNKIYELFFTSNQWLSQRIPLTSGVQEEVRFSTKMVFSVNRLFYTGLINNNMGYYQRHANGTWTQVSLNGTLPAAESVAANTQIYVWENPIFEEGESITQFNSTHVFYTGATTGRINYFIYDDEICDFEAPGCDTPNDPDGYGWGIPGYDCSLCKNANGVFNKVWYHAKLGSLANTVNVNNNAIVKNGSTFVFVGSNQLLSGFTRNVINELGLNVEFHDEFNYNSTLEASPIWKEIFHWGNPKSNACDKFCYEPEMVYTEFSNLVMKSYLNTPLFTCFSPSPDGLYNQDISRRTSMLTTETGGSNAGTKVVHPDSYMEVRSKVPRGKEFWAGFWLSGTNAAGGYIDLNVFEQEGNGKVFIASSNNKAAGWQAPVPFYAIGYRFYDGFYTYAAKWVSPNIEFYFNNEYFGSVENRIIESMPIMFTSIIQESHGLCEVAEDTGYFITDYIRIYDLIPPRLSNNITPTEDSKGMQSNILLERVGANLKITYLPGYEAGYNLEFSIYNANGLQVLQKTTSDNNIIFNSDNYAKGVYFITINDRKNQEIIKRSFVLD